MLVSRPVRPLLWLLIILGAVAGLADLVSPSAAQQRQASAPPQRAAAVFAGGCFWCTEADFDKMAGVVSTTSGYTGGKLANPSYGQVSRGTSGHIEAVRVVYDPAQTSYDALLRQFLRTVDPLDDGGAFCDRGYQYRAALFPASKAERAAVTAALAQVRSELGQPVKLLVLPVSRFWPAEDYHQDYYRKNPARYRLYRWNCGRDQRLAVLWGKPGK